MLLSVYIITYNHGQYIAKAIESVLMQNTNFNFEIVIGEDCSTDNTRQIIESYILKNPGRIRLITSDENVGPGKNAVRTLRACQGKYIAAIEGDDFWLTDTKLQKQTDILEHNNNISFCFTDRSTVDSDGKIIQQTTIPEKYKRTLTAADVIGGFTPPTQTVVFRSCYLNEEVYSGLERVFNGESYAFSYFASLGDVAYINEITACYRVSNDGIYSNTGYITRLERREKTFDELSKILTGVDKTYLFKGYSALNQRLYVLYFKNFKIRKLISRILKMIDFDFKNHNLSLLKANRLLLKSFFYKGLSITD